jgi:hypothetical protein
MGPEVAVPQEEEEEEEEEEEMVQEGTAATMRETGKPCSKRLEEMPPHCPRTCVWLCRCSLTQMLCPSSTKQQRLFGILSALTRPDIFRRRGAQLRKFCVVSFHSRA